MICNKYNLMSALKSALYFKIVVCSKYKLRSASELVLYPQIVVWKKYMLGQHQSSYSAPRSLSALYINSGQLKSVLYVWSATNITSGQHQSLYSTPRLWSATNINSGQLKSVLYSKKMVCNKYALYPKIVFCDKYKLRSALESTLFPMIVVCTIYI